MGVGSKEDSEEVGGRREEEIKVRGDTEGGVKRENGKERSEEGGRIRAKCVKGFVKPARLHSARMALRAPGRV